MLKAILEIITFVIIIKLLKISTKLVLSLHKLIKKTMLLPLTLGVVINKGILWHLKISLQLNYEKVMIS